MSGNALVVLLLEDEPLIAMDVEQTLRDAGFDVTTVTTCAEAIDWLAMCRPDLVVVDVILRDGPCNKVVEQLIADRIPFLMHSGDNPSRHYGTPFAEGTWISKPAEQAELVRAARELLSAEV